MSRSEANTGLSTEELYVVPAVDGGAVSGFVVYAFDLTRCGQAICPLKAGLQARNSLSS